MKIQPSKLAELSENWFHGQREELAAMLAAGEPLMISGKTMLTFESVEYQLFKEHEEEARACMKLCAIEPTTGGKHMRKLLEGVALELVDAFKGGFRASYEEEINRGEAA